MKETDKAHAQQSHWGGCGDGHDGSGMDGFNPYIKNFKIEDVATDTIRAHECQGLSILVPSGETERVRIQMAVSWVIVGIGAPCGSLGLRSGANVSRDERTDLGEYVRGLFIEWGVGVGGRVVNSRHGNIHARDNVCPVIK